MQKAEALPFLMVEEAIKRSKYIVRFQEELGLAVWERARIELVYIRNLNEWIKSIQGKVKTTLDRAKDCANDIFVSSMVKEAECTARIHQHVHNLMMAPDGPYIFLQRGIGLNKIGSKPEERLLSEIEKHFNEMNKKRLALCNDIKKRQTNIEKMKSTIIQSEEQLSKRSRLAKSRSSSRGHRKVDHIVNRLSMLRKQIESETAVVDKKDEQLVNYMKERKEIMRDLYRELTNLQKQRFDLICSQLKMFTATFKGFSSGYKKRRSMIQEMDSDFESIDVSEMIKRGQKDIEAKANSRKNGHIFELQELFSPVKTREVQRREREGYFSATTLPKDERNNTQLVNAKSAMDRIQTFNPLDSNESDRIQTFNPFDSSESDSVLVDTFCASSSESVRGQRNHAVTKLSDRSDSSLDSRIETIVIPNEPVNSCKMPPPFPTKEFCVSSEEEESKCSFLEGKAEFDAQIPCPSKKCQRILAGDEDVGMLRNVKVVATHDFVARQNDQLSFKKGQVIKQKLGENEDGFSYGWFRENRLTPKQYGWYPAGIVQVYVPSTTYITELQVDGK